MDKRNDDATSLLQALAKAMEQALGASERDERAECEAIWKQMGQRGGIRRRVIAWRKQRVARGDDDERGDGGSGASFRPRCKR